MPEIVEMKNLGALRDWCRKDWVGASILRFRYHSNPGML
jgi:hypothetical protein